MKKTISVIAAIMFLIAGQAWTSQVINVALLYQDGHTVARVDIKGAVRFTHQTEQAKDGKPFRVIVDVLSATHHLPARNFLSLPECPVQRIRTSQYAVKPEKVVRLVFDMEGETVYRVISDDNSITLFFPDRHRREFAGWSSTTYAATPEKDHQLTADKPKQPATTGLETKVVRSKKSVAEINQAIDNDRLLSLAGELPATSTSAEPSKTEPVSAADKGKIVTAQKPKTESRKALPKVQPPEAVASDTPFGPQLDLSLLEPPAPKPLAEASPATDARPAEPSPAPKSQPGAKTSSTGLAKDQPAPSEKLASTTAGAKAAPNAAQDAKPARVSGRKLSATGQQSASTKVDDKKIVTGEKKQSQSSRPTVAKKTESKSKTPEVSAKVEKIGSVSGSEQLVSKEPGRTNASSPPTAKPSPDKSIDEAAKPVLTSSTSGQQPAAKKNTRKEAPTSSPKAGKHETAKDRRDSTATLKEKEGKDAQKSTSRFRRSPTRPTKIKGTLVAEFPKRLVIKYKARSHRDPFETLINETRTYNNPIEKRIPNVEGLKLVGVLESAAGVNSALFEDNDGYGYILRKGDKVKKGYVLRIDSDRVYFQIFEYGWSRTLALNIDEY